MRNYAGYNNRPGSPERDIRDRGRTKLIIEDNTIYEIDLDCYECRCRQGRTPQRGVQCPDRTVLR